jgi:hypothetical protein
MPYIIIRNTAEDDHDVHRVSQIDKFHFVVLDLFFYFERGWIERGSGDGGERAGF